MSRQWNLQSGQKIDWQEEPTIGRASQSAYWVISEEVDGKVSRVKTTINSFTITAHVRMGINESQPEWIGYNTPPPALTEQRS